MTAPTMTEIPGFRGDLIAPGDDRYDSARARWNGNVDRRPRQRLPQQQEHPSRLSGGRRRSTRWMVDPDAWDEDDNHDGVN
jgi:hypothetical protein